MSQMTYYTELTWPVWYQPDSPLGAAARYIASFSPRFHGVAIYISRGKHLKLGPYLGEIAFSKQIPLNPIESAVRILPGLGSEWGVLIGHQKNKILGQICVKSRFEQGFDLEEQAWVHRVAQELSQWWPKK
jgi:putative methionine-R-sulfoxide reductase with GAF domain